jgi:CubicO group peptidase (beta-lactamase class C family)
MKKLFRSAASLLFLSFLLASVAWGQGLPSAKPADVGLSAERLDRIDPVIKGFVDRQKVSGAVTLVARNGKIVHLKAFGMKDAEKKEPTKADTIFRIASMTKPVTSVVLMLMEEGKLLLNDPISKYIPEFKNPKVLVVTDEKTGEYTTVPAKREITILQLMAHTAGLTYVFRGRKPLSDIYRKAGISYGLIQTEGTIGEKVKVPGGLKKIDGANAVGAYTWSGIFNTRFWVDPEEKMISIILTQIYPFGQLDIHEKFRVLTYQAIVK